MSSAVVLDMTSSACWRRERSPLLKFENQSRYFDDRAVTSNFLTRADRQTLVILHHQFCILLKLLLPPFCQDFNLCISLQRYIVLFLALDHIGCQRTVFFCFFFLQYVFQQAQGFKLYKQLVVASRHVFFTVFHNQ